MTADRRTQWRERARPRRVITATGLAGAGLLAASLSVRAGSRQFYLLTAGLACTWAGGARAAGPLPWSLLMLHYLPPLFETSPAAQDRPQASTPGNGRKPA